jgi:hypothetical protein
MESQVHEVTQYARHSLANFLTTGWQNKALFYLFRQNFLLALVQAAVPSETQVPTDCFITSSFCRPCHLALPIRNYKNYFRILTNMVHLPPPHQARQRDCT